MDNLDRILSEITKQLVVIANTHGPKSVELLLEVYRIKAYNHIIGVVTALVVSLLLGYKLKSRLKKDKYDDDAYFLVNLGGIFCLIFSSIAFLVQVGQTQYYVGLFRPEVLLAYEIMEKVVTK